MSALLTVTAAPSRRVRPVWSAAASATLASRSFLSSFCEKSGDGSMRGRLRKSINDRRIVASCLEHSGHSVRCICMRTSSIPGRVSSTYDKCCSRNSRQSISNILRVRHTSTRLTGTGSRIPLSCHLLHVGRNDFRERVACPVQPRLHRAEIAVGNLCNLFVRFPLELPENKDVSVVLR